MRASSSAGILALLALLVLAAACSEEGRGAAAPAGGDGGCSRVVASVTPTDTDRVGGLSEVRLLDGSGSGRTLTGEWVASRPSLSPDGDEVAVVRADGDFESSGPDASALWVVGVDDDRVRRAVTEGGDHVDDMPAWSPDGESIAFARSSGRESVIAVVPADGGEPRVLAGGPGVWYVAPAWSPDGETLAFVSVVSGDGGSPIRYEIRTVAVDGSSPARHLTDVPVAHALDWHPDGDTLLASGSTPGGDRVTVVQVADGATRHVTGVGGPAAWSVDGGTVVYFAPSPTDDGGSAWTVARGRIDGDSVVRVEDLGGPAQHFLYAYLGVDAGPCDGG